MSKLRLHGSSSGYTEIAPVAASGNNTLTLPNDGTIISKDSSGAVGVTSVQSTNANFSGTTRITSGISTTLNITTSRINTGIVTTFTATNSTFAGDIDPSANGVYDIGASNLKFKQIFVNNIDASAGIVTAKTFVPTEGQSSHRNIMINGAMNVAQRGTSDTTDVQGFTTVDRWQITWGGANAIIETHQEQLSSSDTGPWALGFRNAYKLVNGNQSSGAQAGDYVHIRYGMESQDLSSSGWNYTSSSDYVTFSFWVKSSVAQNFYGYFRTIDGTQRMYPFETGSLSANTWTKVIKTIPGDSNLQFDNNNDLGMHIMLMPFLGTDFTGSPTLNTWANNNDSARVPNMTSTWWTTDDATFHLTGVQLERGPVSTPFEHRNFGEELARCQRYYYLHGTGTGNYGLQGNGIMGLNASTVTGKIIMWFPVPMRAKPSATFHTANQFRNDTGLAANDSTFGAIWADATSVNSAWCDFPGGSGSNFSESKACMVYARSGSNAKMAFSAEL